MKKLYGVVGFPVKHSLSPVMFKVAFKEYKIGADYSKFEVNPDDLESFMDKVRSAPISGLSVTIPHKETIIPYLDSIDEHAEKIGAVNTVKNSNGHLRGYNTDFIGVAEAIKDASTLETGDLNSKNILILGAGGAAAAAAYACLQGGARVTILNRTPKKAQALAKRFSGGANGGASGAGNSANIICGSLNAIENRNPDLLINATSVGMYSGAEISSGEDGALSSNNSLVPKEFLNPQMTVMDAVYTPQKTTLLQDAEEKGCKIIYGYKMLLHQGAKQFELLFDKEAPTEKMEKALLNALY